MQAILTVIIPVFNDADNVLRCLDSLINQTFSDLEIIVVNDASTDNTLTVLKRYQEKHRFTIINLKQNTGAGYCRNLGIQTAHTPYVTFVDSDDWVDMSAYTKCFEQIFENPSVDVTIYGLLYDYVSINRRSKKYSYSKVYRMSGEFALNIYAHTIPNEIAITPIVNNKIYRKQFLLDNKIFFHENLRYQEDDVFTFEVLARATQVMIVDNCFYHYCQRSGSLIHTVSEHSIHNFVAAYLALGEDLKTDGLFEKYQDAFYLKLKGSLLGVLKRILDYTPDAKERNRLVYLLFILMLDNYDVLKILETLDFSRIRSIL